MGSPRVPGTTHLFPHLGCASVGSQTSDASLSIIPAPDKSCLEETGSWKGKEALQTCRSATPTLLTPRSRTRAVGKLAGEGRCPREDRTGGPHCSACSCQGSTWTGLFPGHSGTVEGRQECPAWGGRTRTGRHP